MNHIFLAFDKDHDYKFPPTMKKIFLLYFILIAAQLSCAPKSRSTDNETQEYQGPFLEEGYYSLENPMDHAVPAVAILIRDGATHVYGFLWYTCENQSFAVYGKTGLILTDKPVTEAQGPTYSSLTKQCVIDTQIEADSDETIKLTLKINGIQQTPFTLKKSNKNSYIASIKKVTSKVDHVTALNEECQDSFGDSCDVLSTLLSWESSVVLLQE